IMDVRSWRLCPIHQAGNGTACSGGGCRKWLLIAKSLSPKWAVPKTASGNGYRIPQREGDSKILEGFRTLAGGKIPRGKEPLILGAPAGSVGLSFLCAPHSRVLARAL